MAKEQKLCFFWQISINLSNIDKIIKNITFYLKLIKFPILDEKNENFKFLIKKNKNFNFYRKK